MLWLGADLMQTKPPIPGKVVTESGKTLYTHDDIMTGQKVWKSTGGMQLNLFWGHGALVAPDWSADWLHREKIAELDALAVAAGAKDFESMSKGQQAQLQADDVAGFRKNTYDAATDTLTISDARAAAIAKVAQHYDEVFSDHPNAALLREQYAMIAATDQLVKS